MKHPRLVLFLIVILLTSALLSNALALEIRHSADAQVSAASPIISFAKPVLAASPAQSAGNGGADPSFLEQQAGLTADAELGAPIDLAKVKRHFRTIEQATDDLLVGVVTPLGYETVAELNETVDIHALVTSDGLVAAYLLSSQNSGAIFDWMSYPDTKLTSNVLESTVGRFSNSVGIELPSIAYFDFRYPDATNLALIADVDALNESNDESDSFEIMVPTSFIVFESAWSAGKNGRYLRCSLNDEKFVDKDNQGWTIENGRFSESQFLKGRTNVLTVWGAFGDGPAHCGIALIYRGVP